MEDWTVLTSVAPIDRVLEEDDGPSPASYLASTLSASLELVKEGVLEARQLEHFQDIYLRTRAEPLEIAG
jgi:segregation and condensation protein A